MALSVPERIAQIATHFANHTKHGYSQPNRGTGDVETFALSDGTKVTITDSDIDCSEMVRQCVNGAISGRYASPIVYMWTGNEHEQLTKLGFVKHAFSTSSVRRGDVLLMSGHTGVALGAGKQADAHGDEYGGISGPHRGDQTGHEVEVRDLRTSWKSIYRYGNGSSETASDPGLEVFDVLKTITFKKNSRIHIEPKVKSEYLTERYTPGDKVTIDGLIINDGYLWGTYIGKDSGKRRYVVLGTVERLLK